VLFFADMFVLGKWCELRIVWCIVIPEYAVAKPVLVMD